MNEYHRILELELDATFEDVKLAYREMAKVWHPDRFANDPRLQLKAQERMRKINEAYHFLRNDHQNKSSNVNDNDSKRSSRERGRRSSSTEDKKQKKQHRKPPNEAEEKGKQQREPRGKGSGYRSNERSGPATNDADPGKGEKWASNADKPRLYSRVIDWKDEGKGLLLAMLGLKWTPLSRPLGPDFTLCSDQACLIVA